MHWLLRVTGGSFGLGLLVVSANCGSSSDPDDSGASGAGRAGGANAAGASAGGGSTSVAGENSTPSGGTDTRSDGGAGSNGVAGEAPAAAGEAGSGGVGTATDCPEAGCFLSCNGLVGTECQGESCCATLPVEGGTFDQGEPDAFSSTVASFTLDKYEVSVARFRNFVNGYDAWLADANPAAGAGSNAHVAGSGWQAAWNASLPPDAAALKAKLACGHGNDTWAETGNDAMPITCVDWYTAFAFCVWDGGRLPTDAESEYAAVGGSLDERYPWGNTPVLTDQLDETADYAVYHCLADGVAAGCTAGDLLPVGSKPAGKGHYQHLDMVGSVWEWALDGWQENYPTTAQTNYAKLDAEKYRTMRGGCWDSTAKLAHGASRTGLTPTTNYDQVGIRCARNL